MNYYGIMHSIATIAAVIAFAGVCWWAYRPANRKRFDTDAMLPLQTDPIYASEGQRAEEKSK